MSIDHIDHQDYYYHQARYAELLRMSEASRLINRVRQSRKRHKGITQHLLGWIGEYLVAWGKKLQERYGNNNEAPHLDSSHVSW